MIIIQGWFGGTVLNEKRTSSIVAFLSKLCRNERKPMEIITDNGKEFSNDELRDLCAKQDISYRRISVESHGSNCRVESVIGTLRKSI